MRLCTKLGMSGLLTDEVRDRLQLVCAAVADPINLVVTQGSYSHDPVSARWHSHSGGGVFDLRVLDLPPHLIPRLISLLALNGITSLPLGPRSLGPGFVPHLHCILTSSKGLTTAARRQIRIHPQADPSRLTTW
jgi:hypothetical protein